MTTQFHYIEPASRDKVTGCLYSGVVKIQLFKAL